MLGGLAAAAREGGGVCLPRRKRKVEEMVDRGCGRRLARPLVVGECGVRDCVAHRQRAGRRGHRQRPTSLSLADILLSVTLNLSRRARASGPGAPCSIAASF